MGPHGASEWAENPSFEKGCRRIHEHPPRTFQARRTVAHSRRDYTTGIAETRFLRESGFLSPPAAAPDCPYGQPQGV